MKKHKRKADCKWQKVAQKELIAIDKEIRELEQMAIPPPEELGLQLHLRSIYEMKLIRRLIIAEEANRKKAERCIPTSVPREVLSATLGTKINLPEGLSPPKEGCTFRFWRVMDARANNRCYIAISVIVEHQWAEFVRIGLIPWRREMGSWPPEHWAFLICLIIRKSGLRKGIEIDIAARLTDNPDVENPFSFVHKVSMKFRDVVRCPRWADDLRGWAFVEIQCTEVRMKLLLEDWALLFDKLVWRIAIELGIVVEDRSLRPAISLFVMNDPTADKDNHYPRPREYTGRVWCCRKDYIRHRLGTSAKANEHLDLICDILDLHVVPELDEFFACAQCASALKDSDEPIAEKVKIKTLTKVMKELCRVHSINVPKFYRRKTWILSTPPKCCRTCGVLTKMADGRSVVLSKCNGCRSVFYCSSECQQIDWKRIHKVECKKMKKNKKKIKLSAHD